ncbi:AF4/FMR2 family member 4 [Cyclospora cayetanensis]|uniref:AF4/FMR2 family member 4 n=1 Tax=Cyclospora cayetanensis TaxID=88456 RepID=A0A6P6RUE8_9EIME|nr:AF4/FMR2 family member 4 [Cyclospora cayetanensis]
MNPRRNQSRSDGRPNRVYAAARTYPLPQQHPVHPLDQQRMLHGILQTRHYDIRGRAGALGPQGRPDTATGETPQASPSASPEDLPAMDPANRELAEAASAAAALVREAQRLEGGGTVPPEIAASLTALQHLSVPELGKGPFAAGHLLFLSDVYSPGDKQVELRKVPVVFQRFVTLGRSVAVFEMEAGGPPFSALLPGLHHLRLGFGAIEAPRQDSDKQQPQLSGLGPSPDAVSAAAVVGESQVRRAFQVAERILQSDFASVKDASRRSALLLPLYAVYIPRHGQSYAWVGPVVFSPSAAITSAYVCTLQDILSPSAARERKTHVLFPPPPPEAQTETPGAPAPPAQDKKSNSERSTINLPADGSRPNTGATSATTALARSPVAPKAPEALSAAAREYICERLLRGVSSLHSAGLALGRNLTLEGVVVAADGKVYLSDLENVATATDSEPCAAALPLSPPYAPPATPVQLLHAAVPLSAAVEPEVPGQLSSAPNRLPPPSGAASTAAGLPLAAPPNVPTPPAVCPIGVKGIDSRQKSESLQLGILLLQILSGGTLPRNLPKFLPPAQVLDALSSHLQTQQQHVHEQQIQQQIQQQHVQEQQIQQQQQQIQQQKQQQQQQIQQQKQQQQQHILQQIQQQQQQPVQEMVPIYPHQTPERYWQEDTCNSFEGTLSPLGAAIAELARQELNPKWTKCISGLLGCEGGGPLTAVEAANLVFSSADGTFPRGAGAEAQPQDTKTPAKQT